ncbi:IscS subfamily cysteine desulfurase [Corallococcus sp. AB004]|nr:IscS subfamily cysteine desulfurase [Corallococcus exiguus]NPD23294.1 IscS subfamily cysteine desulfurase [Corallococcus exiguus]NRD43859.1 IscS subfamily cysteine desulfurase [Corallococcus exiguus]RKH98098.1 IscS subfamily cysteine desulfurase [Corallococcus sp. AB038B]RKI45805.1 IscS subfamily cysteine desulfurase [Corallococcus sp. AB004]
MLSLPIYMDNHATTPLDPRVLEVMLPYLREDFGNAASRNHAFGWKAEAAVEKARRQVADLIGASEKEIVFTSGATESDNLAIKGVIEFYKSKGDHIITLKTEHKAVLDTCKRLERVRQERLDELKLLRLGQLAERDVTPEEVPELAVKFNLDADDTYKKWAEMPTGGARVTYLDVEKDGRVSLEKLAAAMTPKTVLVSIMFANNEIGVVQPVAEIGKLCREKGVLFHCDAVQGVGKVPFDVEKMNVDLASISAHKMYGPKGVGALYVRRKPRVRIAPMVDGGGHERGMRSGTLNVASIVGFGAAAEVAKLDLPEESARLFRLRERLRTGIMEQLDMVTVNGSMEHRMPGSLNISFSYVEGEALMMSIKDVAVSSGSACTSASLEPSYVLRALGVEEDMAHSSIRFGLGRFNTEEEVDFVIRLVVDKVRKLRDMSPLYEMAKEGIDLKSIEWTAH